MSYLIVGGNLDQQKKEINRIAKANKTVINANSPDLLQIDPADTIGIDQIRKIKTFLNKKSWQGKTTKTVVIYQAEAMTKPAQNAFLKTLEEPPGRCLIILTANSKNSLLPTIISRCQTRYLINKSSENKKKLNQYWQRWQELNKAGLDEKLNLGKKIKKEDLDIYILALQKKLSIVDDNQSEIKTWLEHLITAKQMVKNNVSHQRAVDWLVLKL